MATTTPSEKGPSAAETSPPLTAATRIPPPATLPSIRQHCHHRHQRSLTSSLTQQPWLKTMAPARKRALLTLRRRLRKARREVRRLRCACEKMAIQRQELDYYRWLIPRAQFTEEGDFDFEEFAKQQQKGDETICDPKIGA